MNKAIARHGTRAVLALSAFLARRESLQALTRACMRGLARAAIRLRGVTPAADVAGLGEQWQRAFPSRRQIPIVAVTADTVLAEIHTPCPLRGTGDVHACHRMMEFDRELLRAAGGQFVVLESQAQPGVLRCRVAMRRAGAPLDGLVAAHEGAALANSRLKEP